MFKKIKTVAIAILAILGVLFVIVMLMPDDETADDNESEVAVEESVSSEEETVEETVQVAEEPESLSEEEAPAVTEEASEESSDTNAGSGNTVTVNIPSSEISDKTLKFKTLTLDNKEVTQDVFKDYDLTVVHMWGTYCMPCVKEMGDYAAFYKDLPDNINMIAIVIDVYDGIDTNVSSANEILSNAGAEFVNVRNSDSLYDLLKSIQYVPSSAIVDKDGHIVGKILDGASFEDTKKKLNEYIK